MRISDWSSDVCSSDLLDAGTETPVADGENAATVATAARALSRDERTHPAIAQRHSDGSPDTLSQRWELEPEDKTGLFRVIAYKPTYALFARYSGNPNQLPATPAPGHQVTSPLNLDSVQRSEKPRVGKEVV